jgi:hypothetical protein
VSAEPVEPAGTHDHGHAARDDGHGHSHGLVDPSIVRSHEGVKAVSISLAVLLAAALAQTAIFLASGSVALLADLIHNFGDALTAIPLGVAFFLRSFRGEKLAGLRFHDLRHTAASLAIAAGAHPKQIQEMLGHSSITLTLDRYGHLSATAHEALASKLDEMFAIGADTAPIAHLR